MKDFDVFKKEEEVYKHIPEFCEDMSIGFFSFLVIGICLVFLFV